MPAIRWCLLAGFYLPLLLCTYMALAPSPPDPVFRISDVVLHMSAFVYLTFALMLAYEDKSLWRTFVWMLAYGVFIEFAQSFEVERTAEFKDVAVDVLGIVIGIVLGRRTAAGLRRMIHAIGGRIGLT